MSTKRNTLRDAIKVALYVGAASIVSVGAAYAQDATPAATKDSAKNLDTITVTGSRVRRVDSETASPVLVLDRKTIEQSGKMTIGEIVNNLPNISGAPTTTQVNNGGGTGAATAELRGLGSVRTLVLIDGHRPGPTPVDLNSIPLDLVERIEVLTEGSSTVYGSDAIGGVINFIMRKNYNGAQFTASYGESGHHDGVRKGQSLIVGQSGDKGNVVAGIEYNKYDAVLAGARPLSANAVNLYSGVTAVGGSSRNPNGRIHLPADNPTAVALGCQDVSLKPGSAGTGKTVASNYVCYGSNGTGPFNYQPQNIVLTPQERTNAFALATYNVTDDISAYADFYHQKQTAQSQIAPLPFDTNDGVFISKDNLYNPFGADFGPPTPNRFRSRFTSLGQRIINNSTTNDTVFLGLKGNFGQTWSWDAGFDYNHFFAIAGPEGYINLASLKDAFGPSMLVGGVPTCVATPGDPATAIGGCVPINIFNVNDPTTIAILKNAQVNPLSTTSFIERELEFNASGDVFDLPAGAVKLAVGADQIRDYENVKIDALTRANPVDGTCSLSQETCGTPLVGGFDEKEAYAELFVPLLKNAPFAYALNLDIGARYSKYNLFKGNDSNKLSLEWRPIKDLLLRGSIADVFRAPSAANLFGGATGGAPAFNGDLCAGLTPNGTQAQKDGYNAHLAACGPARGTVNGQVPGVGTPPDPGGIVDTTTAGQSTGVFEGSVLGGFDLQPEKGRSYDFGLVYDPEFVPGLSTSVDFYRITLKDTITGLNPDVAMQDCFNNSGSIYCKFIHRDTQGSITFFTLPTVNLGAIRTDGVDMAVKYKFPVTPWGQFSTSFDFTHINKFDRNLNPAATAADPANNEILHLAGHYNKDFGNYAKWRGDAMLNWSMGNWNAGWHMRWVGKVQIGDLDTLQNTSIDACKPTPLDPNPNCLGPTVLRIGNYFNSAVTAGYNFGAIGTMDSRVDVGVDNVLDKKPPFIYSNYAVNGNTDVSTYDTIGRLFWARFTAKF